MISSLSESTLAYFKRMGLPIAAVATAAGGPIAVIRVSGKNIAQTVSPLLGELPPPGQFQFKKIKTSAGEIIDEGLLLYFKAPHSFTGEDVLEIQTHGVATVLEKILKELYSLGAQEALPGEFSFRAVKNEKMTLAQAEGLHMALAIDGLSTQSASRLLATGTEDYQKTTQRMTAALSSLAAARARIEAAIDFSEAEAEQAEDIASAELRLKEVQKDLALLLTSYYTFCESAGEPRIAILGKPNAGKSTLMNVLCGGRRSIVSDIPGTTRDVVEARLKLKNGQWVRLLDTAGLRFEDGVDGVESEGIELGLEAAKGARALLVLESLAEPAEKTNIDALLSKYFHSKPKIHIGTHADNLRVSNDPRAVRGLAVDLITEGNKAAAYIIENIEKSLADTQGKVSAEWLVSTRQAKLIELAVGHVEEASAALKGLRPIELAGDLLRLAEEKLRFALGESLDESYIGQIFAQFCLGK